VLNRLPLIPIVALSQNANNLSELLQSQLPQTRDKYRLQIEMEIDDFRSALAQSRQKYDIVGLVEVLEKYFADR
jgi:hypothetical protein